jgi:hypothetical protein
LVQVRDISHPIVNLLGITTVNLDRWKEYKDANVVIEDNFDSDSLIRANKLLVITSSLPRNTQGNWFGNAPGIYSVNYVATDLSGNSSPAAIRTVNVLPEGPASVSEVMNIEAIMSVYPNPTSGKLYLRLVDKMDKDIKVTVLDLLGKSILTECLNGKILQAQELDLSKQPSGIYLLKVEAGEKVYMKKIQVD